MPKGSRLSWPILFGNPPYDLSWNAYVRQSSEVRL
jgi:hypothetical protein